MYYQCVAMYLLLLAVIPVTVGELPTSANL